MDTPPQTSSAGMPYGHLEQMLKETHELAKENNRRLRRMERNAIIGVVVKVVIWLLVLGVPLFFLSSYLGPLMQAFEGSSGSHVPAGIFGLPSAEQLQQIVNTIKTNQQ